MARTRFLALFAALGLVAASAVPALPASAAATDVVISEIMFNPVSGLDGDEFLELANSGTTAVDISGWCFSGITLCFPTGTSLGAGARLVVARDAVRFQFTYGFAPAAVYTGGLSNSGETISLRDATTPTPVTIDSVAYTDRDPWPTTTDGQGPSIELIDPATDNNDPVNWAASTAGRGHTAGAVNSVNAVGLKPRITAVTAAPAVPTANQAVTVTATVTGQTQAPVLVYRTMFNAEQTVVMTSAGADVYSGVIPGTAAGQLIRYRVEATNAAGTNRSPRADDTAPNKGVVVASGVTSNVPVLEWFMADADYNEITARPEEDISNPAVLAYDGQVFDNVQANIRGQGSQTTPKPNWKFEMPKNHELLLPGLVEPVDEFAMQAQWSDTSHGGREALSWDAFGKAGVMNAQFFPVRLQRNARFQGLYTYLDLFDGTWRDREGYSDGQFFKADRNAFDATVPIPDRRFEKKNPDDGDYTPLEVFLAGIALTGTAEREYMLANADLPQMINYAAVTAILDHVDSTTKNFYLDLDPATGRWRMLPWDLDHTLGNHCCFIESDFVTPAEPGDRINEVMRALFANPQWQQMYFRRLRTLVNQLLATGQMEALYDAKIAPAQPEITLDFATWPYSSSQTYANQRSSLFSAIQGRRTVFGSDPRVPANQPATPNIVISEIQPSAATSGSAFVELYNPSTTTAIDVSGWSLSGSVSLAIQPGTVILPGGRMTFVANDPVFRATYGTQVFVGGRFTGTLPAASGSLTLTRPDASVADTVTYGGEGWPDASTGRSMELTDPALDNSLPTSWAASVRAAGSPGAAPGSDPAAAPGAPTIGTAAAAANGSVTVRWTAPAAPGGTPVSGYRIRLTDGLGAQVGALRWAAPSATSLVIPSLTKGATLQAQVTAINDAGAGTPSALSNAVTMPATTVPGPPVIGTATAGTTGSPITATIRWTPPANTGGTAITNYVVTALRMSSSAANATVLSRYSTSRLGASARSRSFTLVPGTYRFEVVAFNVVGESAPSNRSAAVVPR